MVRPTVDWRTPQNRFCFGTDGDYLTGRVAQSGIGQAQPFQAIGVQYLAVARCDKIVQVGAEFDRAYDRVSGNVNDADVAALGVFEVQVLIRRNTNLPQAKDG